MNPGTHFTSDEDDARGYRWAVVISSTVLMLSYVDGERAERQLDGEVPPGELARSFLASLKRQRLLSGCLTAEQLVENADVHVGGSLHAFHKGAAPPLIPLGLERKKGVKGGAAPLVGEAYGPTVLRAWMEGACASAAEAARTLNARS